MLLFISTSHKKEFVYLFNDKEIIFSDISICFQDTKSFLINILLKLKQSNLLELINKIIVSSGPGSFTSIRIADIFAKSISLKYNIKYLKINLFHQLIEFCKEHNLKEHVILIPTQRHLYSFSSNNNKLKFSINRICINQYQSQNNFIIYKNHFEDYKEIIKKYCNIKDSSFYQVKNEDNYIFENFYDDYDNHKDNDVLYCA